MNAGRLIPGKKGESGEKFGDGGMGHFSKMPLYFRFFTTTGVAIWEVF
jgi:hypothetical protein